MTTMGWRPYTDAFIDWQAASVEPVLWYADKVPEFAIEHVICMRIFEICSRLSSRDQEWWMNAFFHLDYNYRNWKDGAVALRHELIETTQKLGLQEVNHHPRKWWSELDWISQDSLSCWLNAVPEECWSDIVCVILNLKYHPSAFHTLIGDVH